MQVSVWCFTCKLTRKLACKIESSIRILYNYVKQRHKQQQPDRLFFLILQDALRVMSKCCTLVHSSGNDDFLVTKFCQLIVNLFAKQKVCTCKRTIQMDFNKIFFELSNHAHPTQQALSRERVCREFLFIMS